MCLCVTPLKNATKNATIEVARLKTWKVGSACEVGIYKEPRLILEVLHLTIRNSTDLIRWPTLGFGRPSRHGIFDRLFQDIQSILNFKVLSSVSVKVCMELAQSETEPAAKMVRHIISYPILARSCRIKT